VNVEPAATLGLIETGLDASVAEQVCEPLMVPPETINAPETFTDEAAVTSTTRVPVARSTAVRVVVPAVIAETRPAEPVVLAIVPSAALADGTATTESSPAPSADTATSAMRLRSVFVDMFFLSLVRFRNFLDLARRSFDLLIPFLL
jgi:hypothetical protein